MDGTLTVPMHDFAWLREQLGLEASQDILHTLEGWPEPRRQEAWDFINRWEEDLARRARAWPDAGPMLETLANRGCRLGILTRNSQEGARTTLDAAGLLRWFQPEDILGRDDAAAKPSPDGVLHLLRRWGASAEEAVMVGDWIHDIRAGRNAGTATVLIRRHPAQGWEHEADHVVEELTELLHEAQPQEESTTSG